MKILDPKWLTQPPYDYELKKYIFLAADKQIKDNISNNLLYSSLSEIEFHLNKLYKLKYDQDELEDSQRIITGINIDLMDLEYEYPEESEEFKVTYEMVEYAIEKLEHLHKKLRDKWRSISDQIHITEIPDRKPTKKKGIAFVTLNEYINLYSYVQPDRLEKEWETLELAYVGKIDNSLRKIAETISAFERQSSENRFWRFDTKTINIQDLSYEDAVLPIIRHNLFYKLRIT